MKILSSSEEYEKQKRSRKPLTKFTALSYAEAVRRLETEADRLRAEFEQAAAKAASPYHLGSKYEDMAWMAQEFLVAASWLRKQS